MDFFLKTLKALREELREQGGDLLVLDAKPQEGLQRLIGTLRERKRPLPRVCSFNRDYEPFARVRDAEIEKLLNHTLGMAVLTTADHLLIEPGEVLRPDGAPYQVFTPFSRAWLTRFARPDVQARLESEKKEYVQSNRLKLTWKQVLGKSAPFTDQLKIFENINRKAVTVPLPEAGSAVAYLKLLGFRKILKNYPDGRDYPNKDCTSKLSIYLKNGSLTTAQIFSVLGADPQAKPFLRQLIWREFYYHILFHHPRVENEAFRVKHKNIEWQNREDWFEAWKAGRTGYPIIDAGMRELLKTGLMHNRVRMVVASFLTKDLLIDWRWGEQWFMQNLLDGDLAANNGGWQWAASTGCDPQPYFRIFNPTLQSRRFDPNGQYIRRYVPELAKLSDRDIHEPPESVRPHKYPAPIVNHTRQKLQALRLYR